MSGYPEESETWTAEQWADFWVIRMESGLTADEAATHEIWLNRSQDNRAAFQAARFVWDISGSAAKSYSDQADRSDNSPLPADAAYTVSKRSYRPFLVACLSLCLLISGLFYMQPENTLTAAPGFTAHNLPDGSVLRMAGGSQVAINFDGNERRINLPSGTIYVDVQHNPTRPFIVEQDGLQVKAVGTEYSVARYQDRIWVNVFEGVVSVTAADNSIEPQELIAGQGWSYSTVTRQHERMEDISTGKAFWQNGQLIARNSSLAEILYRLEMNTGKRVLFIDDDLKNATVSGVFQMAESERALALLSEQYGIDRLVLLNSYSLLTKKDKS